MRRILIENARRKRSLKRGGELVKCELQDHDVALDAVDAETILALDEALTKLAAVDEDSARLIELRYFTGLTIDETAKVLNVSPRTVSVIGPTPELGCNAKWVGKTQIFYRIAEFLKFHMALQPQIIRISDSRSAKLRLKTLIQEYNYRYQIHYG